MSSHINSNLHHIDPALWNKVKERASLVKHLYDRGKHLTKIEVEEVADSLGLSISYVYKLLKQFRINPKTSSLLPKNRGWSPGKSRLTEEQEVIISNCVEEVFLQGEKPSVKALFDEVKHRCKKEGVIHPSRQTVGVRVSRINKRTKDKRRLGPKKAHDKYDPVKNRFEADHPLQIVQIDHTLVDLIVADEHERIGYARPWITLAIDVFTRLIVSFYLSLERPSSVSVAATMAHMFLPKKEWLNTMGINIDWPARGIPECIAIDNAKEFRSKALRLACDEYDIEPLWRPVRKPEVYGAHIERLIGTTMGAVHLLPGTTFSNIQERGDYKSNKKAILSFEEAEKWIALQIVGRYHQNSHSGIGVSPIVKWDNSFNKAIDYRLDNLDQQKIFIDFLPFKKRTISREGIRLFNIFYWDDVLTTWLASDHRKVIVKYNPRDMSRIFIMADDDNGKYWEIPYRDLRREPVTLWEIRSANKQLIQQGIESVDEEIIFETIEEQRRIVEEAKTKKRAALRSKNRVEHALLESEKMVPRSVNSGIETSIAETNDMPIFNDDDQNDDLFDVEEWL